MKLVLRAVRKCQVTLKHGWTDLENSVFMTVFMVELLSRALYCPLTDNLKIVFLFSLPG